MPLMSSPYVGKPVNVPDDLVDRFKRNGYEIVGVAAGEPDTGSDEGKASKRRRGKE